MLRLSRAAMIASIAIAIARFAFAWKRGRSEIGRAFQASSPKNFQGWSVTISLSFYLRHSSQAKDKRHLTRAVAIPMVGASQAGRTLHGFYRHSDADL
jgi:hypothetical protein